MISKENINKVFDYYGANHPADDAEFVLNPSEMILTREILGDWVERIVGTDNIRPTTSPFLNKTIGDAADYIYPNFRYKNKPIKLTPDTRVNYIRSDTYNIPNIFKYNYNIFRACITAGDDFDYKFMYMKYKDLFISDNNLNITDTDGDGTNRMISNFYKIYKKDKSSDSYVYKKVSNNIAVTLFNVFDMIDRSGADSVEANSIGTDIPIRTKMVKDTLSSGAVVDTLSKGLIDTFITGDYESQFGPGYMSLMEKRFNGLANARGSFTIDVAYDALLGTPIICSAYNDSINLDNSNEIFHIKKSLLDFDIELIYKDLTQKRFDQYTTITSNNLLHIDEVSLDELDEPLTISTPHTLTDVEYYNLVDTISNVGPSGIVPTLNDYVVEEQIEMANKNKILQTMVEHPEFNVIKDFENSVYKNNPSLESDIDNWTRGEN